MGTTKDPVRLAVIGVGGMAQLHLKHAAEMEGVRITAVCDPVEAAREAAAKKYDCQAFADHKALIDAGVCDAVLIVTPHYFHTTIGIDALKAGLHVLVEKPISVHKADCERLIAAHTNPKQVFAAMFNQRTDPYYLKLKQLIDTGELGGLIRVSWIITNWFRTETYYRAGAWRATWKGEGGGVLMNQCPHQLDLMQWLFGMPKKVAGFCGFGVRHDIEVEDQATAFLEYDNGATGTFITSTGEAPGTNRLEVAGERGKVVIEDDRFTFIRNEVPAEEFIRTSPEMFGTPDTWHVTIPVKGHGGQHKQVLANFIDAIRNGAELIAPAEQGIHSVELANAILYSSLLGKPIDLPLDGKAFEDKLNQLIRESCYEKKAVTPAKGDLSKSFV